MHVVVTGASSGIGEALVREYAAAGAKVTMVARRKALLDALATTLGATVRVQVADLGDPAQATAWIDDAIAAFGPIDLVINNAGVQIVAQTQDISVADLRNLLEVDLYAPLAIIAVLLPKMLARGSGAIVNISSVAALAPPPGMVYYNAAKAGLGAASESLRGELRRTPITVVTVYPGPVDTALARAAYAIVPPTAAVKMLPEGNPAQLAQRIRRAVERKSARVIYPRAYALARHTPAMSRIFMDAFTPLPASQLPAAKDGSG